MKNIFNASWCFFAKHFQSRVGPRYLDESGSGSTIENIYWLLMVYNLNVSTFQFRFRVCFFTVLGPVILFFKGRIQIHANCTRIHNFDYFLYSKL